MSLLSAGLLAFSLLLAPPQDEVVQDAQTANREPAQTAQKTTDDSTPTIEQPEADGDTEDTKADPVEPDEADKSDNELNEESLNGSVPATMPSLPATEGNPDERMDQGVSADPPTVEATRRETTAVDAGNTADSSIWSLFGGPFANQALLGLLALTLILFLGVSIVANTILLKFRFGRAATDGKLWLPAEVVEMSQEQHASLDRLTESLATQQQTTTRQLQTAQADLAELKQSFAVYKDMLAQKDQEIQALKSGYEAWVYRGYIERFLTIADGIAEDIAHPQTPADSIQGLQAHRKLLLDALKEYRVHEIHPTPGEPLGKFEEADLTIPTDDNTRHMTIESVLKTGFRLSLPEGRHDVIRPARVRVYKYTDRKDV